MPPPHDHHHHHHHEMEDWDDYDWDELPPHLKDAAGVLGWTQKLWDEDGKADTEDLDWGELSHEQRKAAEQFGYHPKLWDEGPGHHPPHHHDHHHDHQRELEYNSYAWDKLPAHLKEAAGVLGWTKKTWEGGEKSDLDGKKWPELTHEQHKAAEQFGYHPHLWDHGPHGRITKPGETPKEEEKKEGEDDTPDVSNMNINDGDGKKQAQFKLSKKYGGNGGDAFDHGTNRHISKITIYTDGHVVTGLEVGYANATKKAGGCGGKGTAFELERGEFITQATVRHNMFVQSLGFKTNKGKELGPVGGKGWTKLDPRGKDTEGDEEKVPAPFKFQLCGLTGRQGKLIDQIAFRWGPVPQQGKKQSK